MARRLWAWECKYKIFKEGEYVGWIQFVKRYDKHKGFLGKIWEIAAYSGDQPVCLVDYSAKNAKEKLDKHGYSYEAGEIRKRYLYYDETKL